MDMLSYLLGKKSGGGGKGLHVEVVTELPDTGEDGILYLVPKSGTGENDIFDEYVWVNDDWEHIGSTDIDLSNYYTKNEAFRLTTDSMIFELTSNSSFNNTTATHYFANQLIKQKVLSTVNTDAFYSSVFLYVTDTDNNIALIPAKRFVKNSTNFADGILFYNDGRMCFVRFAVGVGSDGTLTLHIETNPVTNANATKEYVDNITGTLSNLTTTDKTNLVNAINEIAGSSGGIEVIENGTIQLGSNMSSRVSSHSGGIYILTGADTQITYGGNRTYTDKPLSGNNLAVFIIYGGQAGGTTDQYAYLFKMTPTYYCGITTYAGNEKENIELHQLVSAAKKNTFTQQQTFSNQSPLCSIVPTDDSNLVNKKYVDDSIASAITDALGGSY